MQAGMDLTGMSPFRNAHYTPSVPVQHGMYGQVPAVQNGYLDDMGQVCDRPLGRASSCHDETAACGRAFSCCPWLLRLRGLPSMLEHCQWSSDRLSLFGPCCAAIL